MFSRGLRLRFATTQNKWQNCCSMSLSLTYSVHPPVFLFIFSHPWPWWPRLQWSCPPGNRPSLRGGVPAALSVSLDHPPSGRMCEAGYTWDKLRLGATCWCLHVVLGQHRSAAWRGRVRYLVGRMSVIHDGFYSVWCILVFIWWYIKLPVNISNSIFRIDLMRLPRIWALFVMAYRGLHLDTIYHLHLPSGLHLIMAMALNGGDNGTVEIR
jgi:hypothetical protein